MLCMKLKEIECCFQWCCFDFSVDTVGKVCHVCRKCRLRNVHTCHLKISSDRQEGELVAVKPSQPQTDYIRTEGDFHKVICS